MSTTDVSVDVRLWPHIVMTIYSYPYIVIALYSYDIGTTGMDVDIHNEYGHM